MDGFLSKEYSPEEGIPQGGILSCLLWNVYFSDLPDKHYQGMDAAYADDFLTIAAHNKLYRAKLAIEERYARIRDWADDNRVEFNDTKVKYMIIRPSKRKRNRSGLDTLSITYIDRNNQSGVVEEVDTYKYLGVDIDNKLTFKSWIDNIRKQIQLRTNFIVRLKSRHGLGRKCAERLYEGYVRGYINYGLEISSRTKHYKRLVTADRTARRKLLGILVRTRNTALEAESHHMELSVVGSRKRMRSYMTWSLVKPPICRDVIHEYGLNGDSYVGQMVQEWKDHNLPDVQELESDEIRGLIDTMFPCKTKHKFRFHKNHDKERFLCRMRCGVIPTREWLHKLYTSNKSYCRHCEEEDEVETFAHVFSGGCYTLDYTSLGEYVEWDMEMMRLVLCDAKHVKREELEDALWDFVTTNKLFWRNEKPLEL